MYKSLIVALTLGFLPAVASANGQGACAPRAQIVQHLALQYGERQVMVGMAADGHVMELYASPGQEWTLVATRPDGLSCIVVVGTHLGIVPMASNSAPADPA